MAETMELLERALANEFENLEELDIGSKERQQTQTAAENFTKLYLEAIRENNNAAIEESKLDSEKENQVERLALEREKLELESRKLDVEEAKMEQQKKSDRNKMIFEGVKAAGGIAAWILMSIKVMKFEETGTIRSKAFPGLGKIKLF